MNGELLHPQTKTMAQIHEIRNITPGTIAVCGILVRYFCFIEVSVFITLIPRLAGRFQVTILFKK
jgi:hypothetical protein